MMIRKKAKECEERKAEYKQGGEEEGEYSQSETRGEREQRRARGQPLLPVRRSSLTGFISPQLRWALKPDTPKYPNYTCTSCPFVMGILLFLSPPPSLPESPWTQSGQLSGVELRRPAQTSMSVLLEAGGLDVLLMALIGHCISLQLCKYLIRISFSLIAKYPPPSVWSERKSMRRQGAQKSRWKTKLYVSKTWGITADFNVEKRVFAH